MRYASCVQYPQQSIKTCESCRKCLSWCVRTSTSLHTFPFLPQISLNVNVKRVFFSWISCNKVNLRAFAKKVPATMNCSWRHRGETLTRPPAEPTPAVLFLFFTPNLGLTARAAPSLPVRREASQQPDGQIDRQQKCRGLTVISPLA